jgi:hypothetical protein
MECCRAATLPLHAAPNPRMYKGLTAKTPGCVAFSLPVQRRNLRILEIPASFRSPPQPAQRAADKEWRFRARAASGPRSPSCSRDGFRHGITDYPDPTVPVCDGRRALRRCAGPSATDKRRLLPPTCSDGPTLDAPDCVADQDPRKNSADAGRKLRASFYSQRILFGTAPRVAFWPSPHPRIRWTVASPVRAIRAHGNTRPPPS